MFCLLNNSVMCVDDFSVIFFLEIGLNAKTFVLSLASMQVENPAFFI